MAHTAVCRVERKLHRGDLSWIFLNLFNKRRYRHDLVFSRTLYEKYSTLVDNQLVNKHRSVEQNRKGFYLSIFYISISHPHHKYTWSSITSEHGFLHPWNDIYLRFLHADPINFHFSNPIFSDDTYPTAFINGIKLPLVIPQDILKISCKRLEIWPTPHAIRKDPKEPISTLWMGIRFYPSHGLLFISALFNLENVVIRDKFRVRESRRSGSTDLSGEKGRRVGCSFRTADNDVAWSFVARITRSSMGKLTSTRLYRAEWKLRSGKFI